MSEFTVIELSRIARHADEEEIVMIPLSRGLFAKVDASDAPTVEGVKWCATTLGYAERRAGKKCILMHRLIMSAPDHLQVDHLNGDGLDNRRSNLRLVTRSQNMRNRPAKTETQSGYQGVIWDKENKRWKAQIRVDGKTKNLGRFHDVHDAIDARIQAENAAGWTDQDRVRRPNAPASDQEKRL